MTLVERSRWTGVLQNTGITRSGVAQALLTVHNFVRIKYVHQIIAFCLGILMHEALQQKNIADTYGKDIWKIKTLRLNIGHSY